MDEGCSKAVREVFVSLYEKGLIYRGNRIINWCLSAAPLRTPRSSTRTGRPFLAYPLSHQDSDGYVIIATTRPETLLGDTAVAVSRTTSLTPGSWAGR